jgi:hypothetical protein
MHPTLSDCVLNIAYICTDTDSAHVYCLHEWNFVTVQSDNQEDLCAQYRQELGHIESDFAHLMHIRHNLLCKMIAYQCVIHEAATYTFRVRIAER